MFYLTSDIKIGGFKPVKPHSVSWKRSIDEYTDTAKVKLPAIAMLRNGTTYTKVETGLQIKEGLPVEVWAGYDGKNKLRFKGFIARRNFGIPLELECEGYAYQLRNKKGLNKSWPRNTKLKAVLQWLVEGTDIKLSPRIPDVTIETSIPFKNVSGTQVLEWLKDKMLMTVCFRFDELYVGLREAGTSNKVKFRLGWNVIKDDGLKFNTEREYANVNLELTHRGRDGKKKKSGYGPKDGATKTIKLGVPVDDATRDKIAKQEKEKLQHLGYEGTITGFLEPMVEPGNVAAIDDPKYIERKGAYLVDAVEGELGPNGSRQKIKIGHAYSG